EFFRFEDSDHPSFRRPVTARRSYFDWNGETLELTEYFLFKLIDLYRKGRLKIKPITDVCHNSVIIQ
ncbi:hypothetical protein ACTHTN_19940, partial [Neisseria sp. P0015.S006]